MKVKIRRFDKGLPLPEYKTSGAAAMDPYVREDLAIPPGEVGYMPLNIALHLPRGHFVLLAARSSLHKRGILLPQGVGIGDEDFSGDTDEYVVPLYNFSKESVQIKRGERLVQLIVLPVDRVEWEEVDHMDTPSRGSFGSTGVR